MEQQNMVQVPQPSFSEDPELVKRSIYERIPTLAIKIPAPYFAPTALTKGGYFRQMKKTFQHKLYTFQMQLNLDRESIECLTKEAARIQEALDEKVKKIESAQEQTQLAMEAEQISALISKKMREVEDSQTYIEAYRRFIDNFDLYV